MRVLIYLWMLVAFVSLPTLLHAVDPQPDGQQEIDEGVALFRTEDYVHALLLFERAEKMNPNSAILHNTIGLTLSKLGQADKAEAEYLRAIRLDPNLEGPRTNLGVSYLVLGKYQVAENQFRHALSISPQDPFVHYYLATLYLKTSRDREAVAEFPLAKTLIEGDPSLMVQMAKAEVHLDNPDCAEEIIDELETKSVIGVHDEYDLAVLFGQKSLYPAMLRRLQKMAQIEPTSWEAKFDVAIALLYNGRYADAATILEDVAASRPEDANVWSLLGAAHEQSGDTTRALEDYRRAMNADPSDPQRYLDYTRLLMELDQYDEAAEVVASGINRTPHDYALAIRAGAIKFSQGDMGAARSIFEGAIRSNPHVALAYYGLAQTYLHEGNEQKARDILNAALKSTGPDPKLEYLLGVVLEHSLDPTESIAALSKAIELNPGAPEPHYELGKVFLRSGKLQQAQHEFEKVIAVKPDDAAAFFQLSQVYKKLKLDQEAREAATKAKQLNEKRHAETFEDQTRRFAGLRPVEENNEASRNR